MKNFNWLVVLAAGLMMLSWTVGCDSDDGGGSGDSDSDTDTDGDVDTDTVEECEPTANWSNGWFDTEHTVKNWELSLVGDHNADGTITAEEQTELPLTLEDLYCLGVESVVFVVSDADCPPCVEKYESLEAAGFDDFLYENNSMMIGFYSGGLGSYEKTAIEAHDYFTSHYFEGGLYAKGPPTYMFSFSYFPYMAVIDLETGFLLGKDYDGSQTPMPDATVRDLVTQANAD